MASDVSGVRPATSRRFVRRTLPLLLVLPVLAGLAGAFLIPPDGDGGGAVPVAQGSVGGGFHPIAGTFVADETRLDGCTTEPACFEQAFGNVAFRQGPRVALGLFAERLTTDPVVERGCHRITHFIGSAALERFDGDVAKTFTQGSPVCVSGYYHGILERAFLGISTRAGLARAAKELCVGAGRRRGFLDYQCRHGLGHGLMIQTGYDLPVALDVCAQLGSGWDRKACAGGAFMENINTQFGFRSPWLDDENPLDPCERVDVADARSCYLRASWRILVLSDGSHAETAAACARLGRWAQTCFQGYGRDVAEHARYEASRIRPLCRLAAKAEGECLHGAARTIANASGMPGVRPAGRLCAGASNRYRDRCYAGVGLVLGLLHPTSSTRAAACARLSRVHAAACSSAAAREVAWDGKNAWG